MSQAGRKAGPDDDFAVCVEGAEQPNELKEVKLEVDRLHFLSVGEVEVVESDALVLVCVD